MPIKPEPYDMTKKADQERWFREMEGYFRVECFIQQGTDFMGRKYALDAFKQLKQILLGA